MTKRQRHKLIKSVFGYLSAGATKAFESKDERGFDWYFDGQQVFWCLLEDVPIKITPREYSLSGEKI